MTSIAALPLWCSTCATSRLVSLATAVMLAIGAGPAWAAENSALTGSQLTELLAKGLSVTSLDMYGGKNFTGQATFASGGTLSGTLSFAGKSPVPLTGTWKIDGDRVCRTVRPLQPQEVCETWLRSGDKEVTIRVGKTDVGMIRWQ
jgi:hypothetical protein